MRYEPLRAGRILVGLLVGWSLAFGSLAYAQEEDDSAEKKVMERFLSVLEKTPRRGTSLDRVYGYHVEHGSLDLLVKRYEDRTKADPNDGAAWLLLGLVEAQRGRDATAVAAFREAERLRPEDSLAPYYLGQALVLVGQPDTAVEAFERSLTRKPSRTDLLEIYQALGRVHQRARRADKALAVWARLEATFPDDNRVREQIAAALAEEDQPAQALAKYEVLAKEVKDEYRKVQFTIEVAELKVRLGRSPEALADFERLLGKLDPASWLFKEVRRKIEEVFLRGDDQIGLAKYYEAWIGKTPDDVDAMARLGKTYAQLGRASDSRSWLDKAVKLAPSRRELRVALIEQLAQEKKFAEASTQYEALVKAEPGNPDIVRDWGRLLLRDSSKPEATRKADAAAVWKRLAGDEVKDAVSIAQAADLFRSAEMIDDAIALYKRAIAVAPDSAQYREYLGEYYHQLKRPADALATWTAAPTKTAAEKGRLGEVLAGFGYRKEALEPLTDAVKLAPDDFELRIKLADLLVGLDRPIDALTELSKAGKLADATEQIEGVLTREIHAYQVSKTLSKQIADLKTDLDAGKDATAERWTRLARYYEADGKANEAIQAASKGTVADPKSLVAWSTLGRLQEGSGNLAGAAEANRKLASLDRRNRADYLSAIARLEARLGRTQEALKAGRELLAASPGNVERHQEFAELCLSLGEVEEGLDALRRASRANPSDPKASNTLADALAKQFRTEEAIELYWRAFDRTKDLDGRLGVVSRLADQYLQRNQFDRLISRLERELREPERKRELAICLAQAYQSAGDLGTARQQLESLLTVNPRDSALLTQLSNLAEAEGDVSAAARYLKLAVDFAPTPEGTARLGNLYLRSGEVSEAEAIWSKLASAEQDAARAFSAIDSLLVAAKYDTVLTLTERLLLKRPDDWDALYREGVALINLNKPLEAARRFSRILELNGNDDDLAAIPKSRKRGGTTGPSGVTSSRNAVAQLPIYMRRLAANQIRFVTKLDTQRVYANTTVWSPTDFGQARMAAIGWLYAASLKDKANEKDPEAWAKARQLEAEKPGADPRSLWDLYYLQAVRALPREIFAVTVRLARALPNDPMAQYLFLSSLVSRDLNPTSGVRTVAAANRAAAAVDKTPPLPSDEQALMLEAFDSIQKRRPELLNQFGLVSSVLTELKRAKREPEGDAFYKRSVEAATTVDAVAALVSIAADRGDVDGLLSLIEKYDRLASASNLPAVTGYGNATAPQAIARAMGTRADSKDYATILKLLDHVITAASRPDQLAKRLKAKSPATPTANQNYFYIYTTAKAQSVRSTSVDFPTPNPYFDYSSLYALRNAYEIFKKDDLASDLIAHFRTQVSKAGDDAGKLVPTLAISYLLWWNDDKDESLKEYSRATELSRNDVELKLSLADLRAQRGEPAEALEAADSVEPLDQKTMQRREILALRLSVLAGDVDRARKASERLFGLRLDGDTQVQLATQMNQLGMHELSEAVLARARRRSGGNSAALVGLMLQYQKQGKGDIAVQVANQILRQTSGRTPSPNGGMTQDDQARASAVQVFARSGKLKELIARAEAQLETSPTSMQVLQTLVDYYQADNQRDKVKTTYDKMAKLRPDDAKLRFQIGLQLAQSAAPADAIEHFQVALKKEPTLFVNQYYYVMQAFQRAGKTEEFIKLLDSLDFKTFANNPYVIQNALQNMFQNQNQNSREQGMAILRKAWKELPDSRATLLGALYDDEIWKLPEVYDYAREALIPAANKPIVNGWAGIEDVSMWNGDGAVSNTATQLLDAANRQGKLDALTVEISEALKRSPDWTGGKALLGILKARRGKADEARAEFEPLTAKGVSIPLYARMVIAQELDKVEPLRDVALKILEASLADNMEEIRSNGNGFEYGPGKRLAMLYQKAGRATEARDFVLKYAANPANYNMYDPSYGAYQKINQSMALAALLFELGYPADSARFYSDVANDSQSIENAKQYYGSADQLSRQILQGLNQSLQGMDAPTLARTLRTILTPKPDVKAGEPRLDLVLLCHPRELDKAGVTCLFTESTKGMKDNKDLAAEVRDSTERLVATYPDDLSVLAASALLASVDGKPDSLAGPLDRLARVVDTLPLEPLPSNGRANSRQRDEAQRQLILWVVAREAVKYDATRSTGEKLAARALEAAARQLDNRWSLAMLRETGQAALDRKDKLAAETAWKAMLKMVLTPSTPPKPAKPVAGAATKGAIAPGAEVPERNEVRVASGKTPKAALTPEPVATSVITIERFDQVAQLAKLAGQHDLTRVSIEAMREALAGGPPVTPMAIANPNNARVIRRNSNEAQADPVAQKVEEALFTLDAQWVKAKADPLAIYEVYLEAVLPKARPNEVFLYARPLSMASLKLPRSVGALLVKWAVKAGKADELKAAIEARQKLPLAAAPAKVLLAQLEFERKNAKESSRLLDSIREGIEKQGLAVTGEQACHAALPALDVKESAEAAAKVLESSILRISTTDQEEPIGSLLVRLARHELATGRTNEGRKHLLDYLTRMQQASNRYGGDYALFRRRNHIARISTEFARAGLLDDALDQIGQYADAPISADYGDNSSIDAALTPTLRMLDALPVEERYRRIKAWTLPTKDRKSIRWVVLHATDTRLPAPFPSPKPVTEGGLIATPLRLIDAAHELKQLDALATELKPSADAKVENAETLLALVDLARGSGKSAIPTLRARLDQLRKQRENPDANRNSTYEPANEILARKALASSDAEVNSAGEDLADQLMEQAKSSGTIESLNQLRRDLAEFRARKAGNPAVALVQDPGLAFWSPRNATAFRNGATGLDRALWAESGGVVGHVTGPGGSGGVDLLMFRYPVSGNFEFSVEAYAGTYAEGFIGYGGIFADPFGGFYGSGVHNLNYGDPIARPNLFARHEGDNRLTIRVAPGKVSYLVNGHLFYEDQKATPTSPWLVLNASSPRHTAFRNATLTGRPEIPREVALTSLDSLDGWDSSHFNESTPQRRSKGQRDIYGRNLPDDTKPSDFDWHAEAGEIVGRKVESTISHSINQNDFNQTSTLDLPGTEAVNPSRLAYLRPLVAGDSVAYEFFCQPGETMIHPAIGHLAFLVDSEGVKLHALVAAGTTESPGEVGPGNVLDDPAGRREPVTLKAGEWNSATLRLKGSTVAIEINGKLAYERTLDPSDNRIFSFYHDKAATAARARNVVLRGDWPKELTAEQMANLFARSDAEGDRATRRARAAVIDEPILVQSAGDIARAARKLPDPERYAKLLAWVLPGDDHSSIRLNGEFGPTDLVEPIADAKGSRLTNPPTLDCPAIDLLVVADHLGKTDELAKLIESAETLTSTDRRGRLALLAMVRDMQGQRLEVEATLKEHKELVKTTITKQTPDWQRWPELIVGTYLLGRNNKSPSALLDEVVEGIQRDFHTGPLERPIRHARGLARLMASGAEFQPKPAGWIEATIGTAETRGRGQPWPTWTYRDGTWNHTPGHATDLLFLAAPIRGNFELTCELSSFNWREARITYGGTSIGLHWNWKSYEVQRYGRWIEANGTIDPPIKESGDWFPFRMVVKDGRMMTYVQDRKIDDRAIAGESDPWLAVFAAGSLTTSVKNLKITGNPTIPDKINLTGASDLVGWIGDYYGEATQGEDAVWQKRGAEIIGRKLRPEATSGTTDRFGNNTSKPAETIIGGKHESVLRYARPLAEDGEITYEFLYEPGKAGVHPSLDRLAFLLEPDGVKVHRITDGKHDRTGRDPGNATDEPSCRRGPAQLPLKAGEWNRMSLSIRGDEVTLTLNGEVVFVRTLEAGNQRDFGLFGFLDETEVRVKDVVYRGAWPKALPNEVIGTATK